MLTNRHCEARRARSLPAGRPAGLKVLSLSFVILTLFLAQSAHAQFPFDADKMKATREPVVVNGDKVEYFHAEKKVVGSGNISVTYGKVRLTCDKIIVYTDTKEAICEGNVRITQPNATFTGDKINYNFVNQTGTVINANLRAEPFYAKAEKIEKESEKKVVIKKGYITTCDLEEPHYRIQSRKIRIYLDDKVIAHHVLFFIGKVPVLYLPVYVHPLKDKFFDVNFVPGYSGDWGYYLLSAWRYHLTDDIKGFIHLDYRQKKGLAEGVDVHYNAKRLGVGSLRTYYTHENDRLAISPSGPEDDRWRMQFRHRLIPAEDTVAIIEFNKLSDRDVIKDYLEKEYEEEQQHDNYISIITAKRNYTFSFLARKRMNDFFTVVERLPEAKLEVYNQRLWDTRFYYSGESSATNFYKRYDEQLAQQREDSFRADTYHKMSYMTRILGFLNVVPYVATRQTMYTQTKWGEDNQFRSIFEGGINFSTKFYKVFDVVTDVMGLDIHNMRHIITPTVKYYHRHQPTISPDNLFQFDAIDGFDQRNGFGLALENKLQTKRPEGGKIKVIDLATLIVSTDYLFKLKKNNIEVQEGGKFTDFFVDLELSPYRWLFLQTKWQVDLKTREVESVYTDMSVNLSPKFKLGIGHIYKVTETEIANQFTMDVQYELNDKWKICAYERFDIHDQKWQEQEYTITRDLHCWIGEFTYSIKEGEQSVWIVFRLKAFPEIPFGLKRTYHRPTPGIRS